LFRFIDETLMMMPRGWDWRRVLPVLEETANKLIAPHQRENVPCGLTCRNTVHKPDPAKLSPKTRDAVLEDHLA